MGYADRLCEEARNVHKEIDELWNTAQLTDVAVKGAVSVAKTTGLSASERDFALSFGLENAERWHRLAELSEKLGTLIEEIERVKSEAM